MEEQDLEGEIGALSDLVEGLEEDEADDETVTEEAEPKPPTPTATLDQLKKKQRVTKTVSVVVNDEETGDPMEVSLSFRGIPAQRYDKLISAYPPRPADKKQGYAYNPDEFGPALIAATCVEPEMSREDAKDIWDSDAWNRGERMMLLMAAIEVCTAGLNVGFRKRVSG